MKKIISVCFGRWITLLGELMQSAILPIIIYTYTGSSILLSGTFIAETIPWVLVTPFIIHYFENNFSDSFMLRAISVLKGILILLISTYINNASIVLLIFFLLGILNSMYSSYNMKLMKNILPEEKTTSMLSIILAIDDVISIISPLLVSFILLQSFNPISVIVINGMLKILNGILLMFIKIKNDNTHSKFEKPNFKRTLGEMFSCVEIKYLVKIEFIRTIFEGMLMPVLVIYVSNVLNSDEIVYSIGITFTCVAQVVCSTLYMYINKKFTTNNIVKFATSFLLFSLTLLLLTNNIFMYFISMFMLGSGLAIRQLVAENMMIKIPSDENIKSWTSNYNALIAMGYLIGYGISLLNLNMYLCIVISIILLLFTIPICYKYHISNKSSFN